jgi:hypothetical protein
LILAISMLARATTRMILAAQSAYASGRTGVAFAGQTIMITLGLLVVGIQGQLEPALGLNPY